MTAEQIRQARAMLTRPDDSVFSIARLLRVSRSTIYKYVSEIGTGRGQPDAGDDRAAQALGNGGQ
ncbi:helix-turn-helix domain-containing protein [Nocardia sp. NPDC101769]|uniref:helix-turn-helix domain-containing protein n=1 Tax=Nocardia sp. NPDC101769 TaxID=3364333 RepID=UPI003826BBC4